MCAGIRSAEVVLPTADLAATSAFFVDRLAFRVERVRPADDPRVIVLSGHGLHLRLDRDAAGAPPTLRITGTGAPAGLLVAPNGTRVELAEGDAVAPLPPLVSRFTLTRASEGAWVTGRAGMRYRDLLPDRHGGRFVASHIQIAEGGPVPDWVHHHDVRFQMIYCRRGWVRVVYEDQGAPFVMREGDAVLQPPGIRHRVLESSPGLEVIEVGSPALHDTFADHALALPTADVRPERHYHGQRFVRHQAAGTPFVPWRAPGFVTRDLGIAAATSRLAEVRVVRADMDGARLDCAHDGELALYVVLAGAGAITCEGHGTHTLAIDDAFAVPAGPASALVADAGLELLLVTLPAV